MEWRVFFIGPMRGETDVEPSSGVGRPPGPPSDHFSRMVAAAVAELQDNGYQAAQAGEHTLTGGTAVSSLVLTSEDGLDQVTLIEPHELFSSGSISTNVFDAIDDSDLIIADMTDERPAVVYELALAHALGIWTIMLSAQPEAQLMFYLRGYRHALVDFAVDDIRTAEFRTAFRAWLDRRSKRFDSGNPFTDFYGAPIPDISAASGLANGYYENFLSRVLASGAEIVDRRDEAAILRQPVSGVLVVRPTNLRDLADVIEDTGAVLEDAVGDRLRRGHRGTVYVDTHGHGDRTCEFVVDGWLIDVPRTVLTLERSPRLKRTAALGGRQQAHDHLSGVLISRFLEVARQAVEGDRDIRRKQERFFYGSPAEIVRFLETPPDRRPSVW